eukprot:Nk52_evm23s263 gene=Nk52_evmTU23s263
MPVTINNNERKLARFTDNETRVFIQALTAHTDENDKVNDYGAVVSHMKRIMQAESANQNEKERKFPNIMKLFTENPGRDGFKNIKKSLVGRKSNILKGKNKRGHNIRRASRQGIAHENIVPQLNGPPISREGDWTRQHVEFLLGLVEEYGSGYTDEEDVHDQIINISWQNLASMWTNCRFSSSQLHDQYYNHYREREITMPIVYVITNREKVYVGKTDNINRRLRQHNSGRRSGGSEFCEQICNEYPGSRWELAYVVEGFCDDNNRERCATWKSTRNIFASKPHWSFEYHVLHELEYFYNAPFKLKKIDTQGDWHHVIDRNTTGHRATLETVRTKLHEVRDLFCRRYPHDGDKIRIVRVDGLQQYLAAADPQERRLDEREFYINENNVIVID